MKSAEKSATTPVVAANTLAEFAARAEPVDRIVFDEAAEFDRGFDVAEAIQFGIVVGFS